MKSYKQQRDAAEETNFRTFVKRSKGHLPGPSSLYGNGFSDGAGWALQSSVVRDLADIVSEFISAYSSRMLTTGIHDLLAKQAKKVIANYRSAIKEIEK